MRLCHSDYAPTAVHCVGSEKLIVLMNCFRNIEPAISEAVDALPGFETSPIRPQGKMMVLVIVSNAWQILDDFHSSFFQNLSVADAGAFEDEWCSVCS